MEVSCAMTYIPGRQVVFKFFDEDWCPDCTLSVSVAVGLVGTRDVTLSRLTTKEQK
jgi:hypothetical protein